MKVRVTLMGAAVTALWVVVAPWLMGAEASTDSPSPEAVAKALAEASKPGPEHQNLAPLVGQWTYTCKLWMAPGQPPVESAGTIERKWILGKRFVEERIVGPGPDGKTEFEGRGVIGYDKAQSKYTYGWMCTMGTGTSTSLGRCDESGRRFTFETDVYCPVRGKKVQGRDEIHIQSDDQQVMVSYQYEGGKEMKVMEFTAVRQK